MRGTAEEIDNFLDPPDPDEHTNAQFKAEMRWEVQTYDKHNMSSDTDESDDIVSFPKVYLGPMRLETGPTDIILSYLVSNEGRGQLKILWRNWVDQVQPFTGWENHKPSPKPFIHWYVCFYCKFVKWDETGIDIFGHLRTTMSYHVPLPIHVCSRLCKWEALKEGIPDFELSFY